MRSYRIAIYYLSIRRIQCNVNSIGTLPVRQLLAGKHDTIPGESCFEPSLGSFNGAICNLGIYERGGILQERRPKISSVLAAFLHPELLADFLQTADSDHLRQRPAFLVNPAVHHQSVELIGQLPRLTVPAAMRYLPLQFYAAGARVSDDAYVYPALLREIMNRKPGKNGFRAYGIKRRKAVAGLGELHRIAFHEH